jgi:hypothetical protein
MAGFLAFGLIGIQLGAQHDSLPTRRFGTPGYVAWLPSPGESAWMGRWWVLRWVGRTVLWPGGGQPQDRPIGQALGSWIR